MNIDQNNDIRPCIIHRYINKCRSVNVPPGFGDFLRGTMFLHQMSIKYNFIIIIDFSKHKIGKYIMPNHKYKLIHYTDVAEFFNGESNYIYNVINNMLINTDYYVICHNFPIYPLHDNTKIFMKEILNYSPELLTECNNHSIVDKEYAVIHIRTGDYNNKNNIYIIPEIKII